MRAIIGSGAVFLFLVTSNLCGAQVLKQEPMPGKLPAGSVVLVDDGTCGKGKIKQLTGGDNSAMNPKPRTKKCIPK
jgi:hypothetical protein